MSGTEEVDLRAYIDHLNAHGRPEGLFSAAVIEGLLSERDALSSTLAAANRDAVEAHAEVALLSRALRRAHERSDYRLIPASEYDDYEETLGELDLLAERAERYYDTIERTKAWVQRLAAECDGWSYITTNGEEWAEGVLAMLDGADDFDAGVRVKPEDRRLRRGITPP